MNPYSSQENYYRLHSKIYDLTRWAFLFGRGSLRRLYPELPEKPSILDLGCGTGKQLEQLIKHYPDAQITGIDRSEHMLDIASDKLGDSVQLIYSAYFKEIFLENSFDLILGSYSLTMVEEISKKLEYIKYHLKPGGFLLAVDFDRSPFTWFLDWMMMNHVDMRARLFDLLANTFTDHQLYTRKAYLGLYTYSFFKAMNKAD